MSLIDVHCLVHKESPFFPSLVKQMKEEDVNFHIVKNGTNIGLGRVNGFLKGTSSYISFVDYDDLIQPGIFKKIVDILEQGYDWVYTDEVLIDEFDKSIQPGWSSNPELYGPEILSFVQVSNNDYCHHIVAFRRSLLRLDLIFIMEQLTELAECYLYKELGRNTNFYHLKEVGYYWRQHEDNGIKQFHAYKVITEMLERQNEQA